MRRPALTPDLILAWADAWRARTGRWPRVLSGPIPESPGDTWRKVDGALRRGCRGLPGGGSLPRLLRARNGAAVLTEDGIRAWAERHRRRTGRWPSAASGPVADAPGETWARIDQALVRGLRGLCGGQSLSRLLRPLKERSWADR
jgi:hypothetical protein